MLDKMRWHFIWTAVAAIAAVLIVVAGLINVINYVFVTQNIDTALSEVAAYASANFDSLSELEKPNGQMPWSKDDTGYDSSRFFIVQQDSEGSIKVYTDSVSTGEAEDYADSVLSSGKSSGFDQEYRYSIYEDNGTTTIVFMNVAAEQKSMGILTTATLLVTSAGLLTALVLIILFSKRVIQPYAENIERQKRFITDASHEIKTPLTSIATSADCLAMDVKDNEWVENIQKQSKKLSKLVNNLVILSRFDEESPLPLVSEFSLTEALWEVSEPFNTTAKANGKQLELSIEDDMNMMGDKASIQQCISILLDNAVRYADAGTAIQLNASVRYKKIMIEVSNQCASVDVKTLDRLFDRFYRPDESRSSFTGGTGIGLSIAKAIVTAHGGTIKAKSEDGRELSFVISMNQKMKRKRWLSRKENK